MEEDHIYINKLNIELKKSFFGKYHIYRILITDGKKLWPKIDCLKYSVIASCGRKENGKTYLYILISNDDDGKKIIRNILENADIPYSTISSVYTDPPVKLFVNAAVKSKDMISLSGNNYYIGNISFYAKDGSLKIVIDIPEIETTHNGTISIHQARFIKARKGSTGPFYIYNGKELVSSIEFVRDSYIKHGIKDKKAKPLDYLSLKNEGFANSRVWLIYRIKNIISSIFKDDISISFAKADDIRHFHGKSFIKQRDDLDKKLMECFKEHGIYSDIPEIYTAYNIPPKGNYYIKLIPDLEEDEPDDTHIPSLNTQHLTESTYKEAKNSKAGTGYLTRALLTELAIKKCVKENKDILDPETDDIICIHRHNDHMAYIIKTGSNLRFGKVDLSTPIDLPNTIPEETLYLDEEYIIIHDNDIFGLENTDLSPLPPEDYCQLIIENNGKVRGDELRDQVAGAVLDAHIYRYSNDNYIYTSVIGKGMREKISKASYFMRTRHYAGNNDNIDFLLPYLCVTYINAGDRYTKYPYLFKYLSEWEKVK